MSIKGAELNPGLNLFRTPPTDVFMVKYRYVKISPQTSSITPIEIYIDRQSDPVEVLWK